MFVACPIMALGLSGGAWAADSFIEKGVSEGAPPEFDKSVERGEKAKVSEPFAWPKCWSFLESRMDDVRTRIDAERIVDDVEGPSTSLPLLLALQVELHRLRTSDDPEGPPGQWCDAVDARVQQILDEVDIRQTEDAERRGTQPNSPKRAAMPLPSACEVGGSALGLRILVDSRSILGLWEHPVGKSGVRLITLARGERARYWLRSESPGLELHIFVEPQCLVPQEQPEKEPWMQVHAITKAGAKEQTSLLGSCHVEG